MNKALAINCNAKLNATIGATAEDWKGGIPVRVVRNFKLAKHSKYAPEEGNRYRNATCTSSKCLIVLHNTISSCLRYDGIYKVVKYYPDTGKSGFRVWRYLLRRDDPAPAPWTKQGKERIAALGFKPMYPDGYLEAMAKKKTGKKRNEVVEGIDNLLISPKQEPPKKKQKYEIYEIETEVLKFIEEDQGNNKLWDECRRVLSNGKAAFLRQISERYRRLLSIYVFLVIFHLNL